MTATQPTVSVGMPVYNGERYIKDAVDSLLNQTLPDIELLIVDNASTDMTPQIASEYVSRDPRVKYFRFRENYGVAHNWNVSFRLSSGRYFKWAAYDDICGPEFLERCVGALEQDSAAVLAYPLTVGINEQGGKIGIPAVVGPRHAATENYDDQTQRSLPLLTSQDPVRRFRSLLEAMWNAHFVYGVIRSEILAKTRLHPSHYAGDHLLLAELSLHGPFHLVPEELFFLRIHEERTSQTQSLRTQTEGVSKPSTAARWWKIRHGYPKRLAAYISAIARSSLSRSERARCYVEVVRATGRWARARISGRFLAHG